jgi:hypothetical protein
MSIVRTLSLTAAFAFSLIAIPVYADEPLVSVWYRGTPAGTPRLDDLAAIKAAGFGAITWPSGDARTVAEVSRLAETVGLTVVIQPDGRSALAIEGRLTVDVSRIPAAGIPAIAWRGVADGIRTISFDPGPVRGPGLDKPTGNRRDWVAPAVAVARQLSANARLIAELRRATSPEFFSAPPASLDVRLLEGSRAWVIVATNTGRGKVHAEVALPRGVPYAIWVSLVDASTIAMLDRPAGARWQFDVEAGAARVYVIDKTVK